MPNDDDYKQIMYLNYQGFTNIMWNLETEINLLWTQGMIEQVYERIKLLFWHVESHLNKKDLGKAFMNKEFEKIDKILYNPANQKFTRMSQMRKESARREANGIMSEAYRELKKNMKESQLEAFYGVPSQVISDMRRNSNINKVFGRGKQE